ncbi:hypothetical protein J2T57_001220 [Natronocella acetinitrilica]|uniref:Uncharacterized protein n=1 Tax=Natronocella acetinitrilica TaxID=414046 RepID=A0AAE3KBV0_9GAMM|nr:hypothetical protein [Natronocella acetinitrilica]MCP1674118.1 hypothetical protein [Natronocella acetinitrilica]
MGSFRDAMGPVAARLRQGRPSAQPVSQVALRIPGHGCGDLLTAVRGCLLHWIERRAGATLPARAWEGEAFTLDHIAAQRTETVALPDNGFWAARIDDVDKSIANRRWITEVSMAVVDDAVLLGCRLHCVSHGVDAPFARSIPGFVKALIDAFPVEIDGLPASLSPWVVAEPAAVERLVRLIEAPGRVAPVIVLALPEGSEDPAKTACSADALCRGLAGVAHVAVITASASFRLSDALGKPLSVFRQAVRTYRPGFDRENDDPLRHPLALPHRIEQWPDGGAGTYERFLIDLHLRGSVSAPDSERRVPSFARVRAYVREAERAASKQAAAPDAELLALAEAEIEALQSARNEEVDALTLLLVEAERERDAASEEVGRLTAKNHALRERIIALERASAAGEAVADTPIPQTLEDFPEWCRRHLAGAVEVLPRALHGVKKSRYGDVALHYQALLLLKEHYVPMRREGGGERKDAFEAACRELGLVEQSAFTGPSMGEFAEQYTVTYEGRKCVLDRHLKKGSTKDDRLCFRLYYFWDAVSEEVVVGSMPAHLDTRAS